MGSPPHGTRDEQAELSGLPEIISNSAVAMRSIVKRFGATTALSGVDLFLNIGEIHAILGENGAGKSTLMHVLAGLLKPNVGEIFISGNLTNLSSPRQARRQGIAMVHQHFTLAPALTVAENLALDAVPEVLPPLRRFTNRLRYSARNLAKPALDQAKRLGWELNPDVPISSLSVGQQQRVEIAKALASGASTLIFDEPTAVLNPREIDELFCVLRRLRDEGRCIVFIAHKLAEILAIADRVTVLRKGHVVAAERIRNTNAEMLARWMIGDISAAERNFESRVNAASVESHPSELPVCAASDITILGDRGEVAIRNLNLEVNAGEIVGIGGVDGNGQAELAETLAGLRKPESGKLTITAARTGYIPQDRRRSGLALSMSVRDNLLFEAAQDPAFSRGGLLKMRRLSKVANEMILDYDIRTPGPDVPASTLSGGNQQKIVVARALRPNPRWVVAMNPTRGLDIGAARFVHMQLRKARDRGAAVIVISTDLDELAAISDRTAVLAGGTLTPYEHGQASSTDIGLLLGGATI